MGNVFYAPLEARGSNAIFQPFLVAGIGLARNKVGEWTRTKNLDNPTYDTNTVRTYEGATTTSLAWSVGIGASLQVTRPGRWPPVIIEVALRHYDFGSASGGSQPIGSGSEPRQPFTFDNEAQVVTLGVRIPLRRF
jgi:opacity protein-like surface antigen